MRQMLFELDLLSTIPNVQAGLGGARDATNVICSSGLAASVITTIGEEHLSALGGSLESIARAKSGIIKHGRPVRWFLTVFNFGTLLNLFNIDSNVLYFLESLILFLWLI